MLKKSLLLVSTTLLLNATSTMCFKKNHQDPSTIETVALDGGKCAGVKNVSDMKKNGFIVDDIKVTSGDKGLDYIYIFKTVQDTQPTQSGIIVDNQVMTKEQLKDYMTQLNEENKIKEKKKKEEGDLALGKKLYTSTCYKCHGQKAEVSAYNTARPLKNLTLEQMQISLRDYENNEKDNGMAILMRPYASKLSPNDVKSIAKYIQTLK